MVHNVPALFTGFQPGAPALLGAPLGFRGRISFEKRGASAYLLAFR